MLVPAIGQTELLQIPSSLFPLSLTWASQPSLLFALPFKAIDVWGIIAASFIVNNYKQVLKMFFRNFYIKLNFIF